MKPCRQNTFKSLFFFVAILPIFGCTLESIEKTGRYCPDYVFLVRNDESGKTIVECADDAELSGSQTCPVDAEYCLTDEADRNFCAINVSLGEAEAKNFPCRSSSETDNTCDCPEHQICVNQKCLDKTNTECNCKKDETCDAGKCIPAAKKCSGDDDCAEGLVCLDSNCSEPVSKPECTGDEDCAEGLVCVNELCTEHAIDCSGDEDCPDGWVCVDDICSKPIIECSGDEDCPEGWVCSDDICTEYFTTCSGDEECAEGLVCSGGICTEPYTPIECLVDDDCASGEICSSGMCVDPDIPLECTADIDCGEGKICQSNVCVDVVIEPECSSDADCAVGKICQSNVCVDAPPEPECSETKPCSGELICTANTCQPCPASTYYLAGNCVQCISHEHCGTNAYCNASNACVQCGDKKVNTAKNACVECLTHEHCGTNAYCDASNACVQCGDKKVNTAKNACVECTSKADCKTGYECTSEKCNPITCDNRTVLCNDDCVVSGGKIIITATANDNYQTEVKSEPKSSATTIGGFIRYHTPDIYGKTTDSDGNTWYIVLVNRQKGFVPATKAMQLPVSFTSGVNLAIFKGVNSDKTNYTVSSGTIKYCHDEIVSNKIWCYTEGDAKHTGWVIARNAGSSQSDIAKLGSSIPSGYFPPECN